MGAQILEQGLNLIAPGIHSLINSEYEVALFLKPKPKICPNLAA
jgi:hypothetical protein